MPIGFISGDLFDNGHGARAIAHGCNCQGVQFRGDKIACERIDWDQATVLRQMGLLTA